MKPTSAVALRQVLMVCLMLAAVPLVAGPPPAKSAAQPVPLTAGAVRPPTSAAPAASAAGCQWTYYPISGGQLQPTQALYNDPDNTPIINLSLGNLFKGHAAQLASRGAADFNGDNTSDVFRTTPRNDGNLQWQYASGGTGDWQNLAYAGSGLPTSLLQFGQFNGDAKSDVFANVYAAGIYYWDYSPSGTGSFMTLNTRPYSNRLALGDFNGDGVTDVFTASAQGATEQWGYFPGGSGGLVSLATANTDPALLRFGDFSGGGQTDVFAANLLVDGSTQWVYSSGGAASYANLVTSTVPYSELQFGDFDGDGKTDVLAALPQNDGRLQVVVWPGGLGPALTLGQVAVPAPALRVGDFNGDGIDDLLALRCGMGAPLAFGPLQTLATTGYSTFYQTRAGDVNGDGVPDVILISTCQNPSVFGDCATHHLQLGAVLAAPAHTHTLVAPQLVSSQGYTYTKLLAGDFDHDGKTDLALVDLDGSGLTITVARPNGDGTFTLSAPQTFLGTWNGYNPFVGDFNGDGQADLAFTTVCKFASGSCSVGDNNNVAVALAGGGGVFTLSATQVLGASGWTDYYAIAGDFNGDGKTDLAFNSTCQKTNYIDSTCTIGDANRVYTALSNGLGGFSALSGLQNYGASGWSDYPVFAQVAGDVNGDGRTDLVWSSSFQALAHTHNNLVVVGLGKPDGSFQLGSIQDFGSAWTGELSLADLNHDGKADLLWNNAPLNNTDVDSYAVATANRDGSFTALGTGSVYTSQGYFSVPDVDEADKVASSLTLVSTRQDSISSALFVVEGSLPQPKLYLPLVKK